MMASASDSLRNYLSWQAELGTDEIMLDAPLALSQAGRTSAGRAALGDAERQPSPRMPGSSQGHPGGSGESAPGLFQMLVKSLEQNSHGSSRQKDLPTPSPRPFSSPGDAGKASESPIPAFASLAEARDFLDRNLPGMITGSGQGRAGALVHGCGPEYAALALVGMEPSAIDSAAGRPFQGEVGALLEKMMRAIRLEMDTLYRTLVVKVGGGNRAWTRRDLVRILPLFQAELAVAKVGTVLLLGETCAQAVLKTGMPMDELRQAPHRIEGVPDREFIVTYHPEELLGSEELKRKAWKDLQWLQQRLQGK